MILYGLVDDRLRGDHLRGVIELYGSRAAAEQARRQVVRDEPAWEPVIRVVEFPLIGLPSVERSPN